MIGILCLFFGITVLFSAYFLVFLFEKNIKKVSAQNLKKINSKILNFVFSYFPNFINNIARQIKFTALQNYIANKERDLKFAGERFWKINIWQLFSLQIILCFSGTATVILFGTNLIFAISIGILLFFLPDIKLKEIVKNKKSQMTAQIPDLADILSITLSAGFNFYSAAQKATKILPGDLSTEFEKILSRIKLGYSSKLALKEFADDMKIQQLDFFIKTITISMDSGTQIADSLKRISKSIREENALLAEKKAHEAPIKILIPLILLIFPTIFIAIFGPIALNIILNGL